jgi:hypothetical protein
MKYEDLVQANSIIKTTDVKGRDYAEVNQRIKAFRSICPEGCIETNLISCENGVCVFSATVKDETGRVLGTGHAYEKENSSFINKTSYIENCETSAVGRALGMCGIGIDTSLASYEEVANAIEQQKEEPKEEKPTKENLETLKELAKQKSVAEEKLLVKYKINDFSEMTMADYLSCFKGLQGMKTKA